MAKSTEQYFEDVIRWCDEQIELFKDEMVAQGGASWDDELSDPSGFLESLHDTRKTAASILKKIQKGKR